MMAGDRELLYWRTLLRREMMGCTMARGGSLTQAAIEALAMRLAEAVVKELASTEGEYAAP